MYLTYGKGNEKDAIRYMLYTLLASIYHVALAIMPSIHCTASHV